MKTELQLIPVLLGGDLNSYNVARAFHEAYGVTSHVFGRYPIGPTQHSKIIVFHEVPSLDHPDILVEELQNFASKNPDATRILLGCTDDYAALIIRNKTRLEGQYLCPYTDPDQMERLVSKAVFYQMCEQYGIPYPKTKILGGTFSAADLTEEALGFSYPVIVKPSSSIVYWKHPFDGMKKVYVAETPAEAVSIIQTIYAAGYDDRMIVQDRIPGDDANMNVLTAYSDKDGHVKMMCLGHVLLEEHTPKGLGNHAAIITEYRPEVTERFRAMLDDIGYQGFSNFDIKYDPRDGSMRAFEINLRQGRSNYYITAAGLNLARLLVEDFFREGEMPYRECKTSHLWHVIPRRVVYRYVHNEAVLAEARRLVREGKSTSSLWYRYDLCLNPRRFVWVLGHLYRQFGKYKKYCK